MRNALKRRRTGNHSEQGADGQRRYAQQAKGGRKCCVTWNQGQCTQSHKDCPRKELHLFAVIENGKTCNKQHRALDHTTSWSASPSYLACEQGGPSDWARAKSFKAIEVSQECGPREVFCCSAEAEVIGRKLAASKVVQWVGRGELIHLPWDPPVYGPLLVIDYLWSGMSGTSMASLSLGMTFCVAAETDPLMRAMMSENLPDVIHVDSAEAISVETFDEIVNRRKLRGTLLGPRAPAKAIRC